jgi:pimeloyl-ACP methyl ester carboxylesterase
MKKLLVAAGVVGCLVAGSAYFVTTSAQATPLSASDAARAGASTYTPPPIAWAACTDGLQAYGAQCGFLAVPLNYANPQGTKIKIAVSRIAHTSDASDYQGAIVADLTDAGGSGISQSTVGQALPASISGDYDWIGFDPRGVGASEPTLSCDATVDGYNRPAYAPSSPSALAALVKNAENYAQACAKTHSELLGNATTTDSAYDLDSLRKALGQTKLSYYGYFYGAYLGEVYASLYPTHVNKMILDSSIDPKQAWFGFNLAQNAPLGQDLAQFAAWAAQYNSVYNLGTTAKAVEGEYYAALAKLTKTPADGDLGPDTWTDDFLLAYNTGNWEDLAGVLEAYVLGGDASPIQEMYDANYSATNDNSFAMSLATECTDASWPHNWGTWIGDTEQQFRQSPFASWADTWFVAPCENWSAPSQPAAVVGGAKTPPILMVLDTTLAPSTTVQGTLAVRKLFPKSVLVESGATPASSATSDSCSPGTSIAEYLAAGILPTRVKGNTADLGCPANPLPDPSTDGSATSSAKASKSPAAKAKALAGPAGL